MDVERYKVDVEFAAPKLVAGSMGKHVSRFESVLPRDTSVHLVKESTEEGVGEVEVCITSMSPAMALRDVSHAIEMASVTPAGTPDKMPDVVRASVAKMSEETPPGGSLESPD